MEESLHDYVVSRLNASKGHWTVVSEGSGVSVRTFSKIARREVRYPRVDTIERLARYFREQDKLN